MSELPLRVWQWLSRPGDLFRRGVAHLVLTVDPEGRPHAAVVDAVVGLGPARLRFALGGSSASLGNLRRTGKATLVLADAGLLCYVKGSARELRALPSGYAAVELEVEEAREDGQPGVTIRSGLTWALVPTGEESRAEARWRELRRE